MRFWSRVRWTGMGVALGSLATLVSPAAWAREVPKPLRGIVMGDRHREVKPVLLNGVSFDALTNFSELPYLMWPSEGKKAATPAKEAEAVRRWLAACSRELGFEGFEPSFVETFAWRDHDVLSYGLMRRGGLLHDARIHVHFSGDSLLGVQVHLEGKIVGIEDVAEAPPVNTERVYYPVRMEDGNYRAVAAVQEIIREPNRTILTVSGDHETYETVVFPDEAFEIRPQEARFTEYNVPVGTFPDQISVAEDGLVWFSQPNNNYLTSFNPRTRVFSQYNTATRGGTGPDGMIVGTRGKVWSGMYYSGSLGWYDTRAGTMHNVGAPYAPAAMAIPVETSDGSVWVTDHQYNKISEFNPVTQQWIRTVNMPTQNCWVVQGYEDRDRRHIYFTEYSANKLGRIPLGGNTVTDINVPGGGPAFCVYSAGKVYYSRWNEAGMGVYDVSTGTVTQYSFPVSNEWGGPMWLRPDGDIVFGTRNRGYVFIFHVETRTFSSFQIPTANAGLKDGLTVGADGVIWFTESGVNKIARLEAFRLQKRGPAP